MEMVMNFMREAGEDSCRLLAGGQGLGRWAEMVVQVRSLVAVGSLWQRRALLVVPAELVSCPEQQWELVTRAIHGEAAGILLTGTVDGERYRLLLAEAEAVGLPVWQWTAPELPGCDYREGEWPREPLWPGHTLDVLGGLAY